VRAFLRENPTIAFGLGLPLVLVVVFLLVSGVPALLVAPPQYDVLYATEYYNSGNGVQISVVDGKVQVVYRGTMLGAQTPRLWRYDVKSGGVREIAIAPPPGLLPPTQPPSAEDLTKITPIDVPQLAGLTVDPSSIAPDGYEFSTGTDDYSRDFLGGLFGYSRYRSEAVLRKDGRGVRLPNPLGTNYYGNYVRLIGWVVSQ
jgi:hypothetical protein